MKPASVEQSAIQIGDSVVFKPAAHAGIREFNAVIELGFQERGITLSTCQKRSLVNDDGQPGQVVLTMIFMLGFDALINPTIFVYD